MQNLKHFSHQEWIITVFFGTTLLLYTCNCFPAGLTTALIVSTIHRSVGKPYHLASSTIASNLLHTVYSNSFLILPSEQKGRYDQGSPGRLALFGSSTSVFFFHNFGKMPPPKKVLKVGMNHSLVLPEIPLSARKDGLDRRSGNSSQVPVPVSGMVTLIDAKFGTVNLTLAMNYIALRWAYTQKRPATFSSQNTRIAMWGVKWKVI